MGSTIGDNSCLKCMVQFGVVFLIILNVLTLVGKVLLRPLDEQRFD